MTLGDRSLEVARINAENRRRLREIFSRRLGISISTASKMVERLPAHAVLSALEEIGRADAGKAVRS